MINLFTILESLQQAPRQLTLTEKRYLDQLADEVRCAGNATACWHILEREGLSRLHDLNVSKDILDKLVALRRSALH